MAVKTTLTSVRDSTSERWVRAGGPLGETGKPRVRDTSSRLSRGRLVSSRPHQRRGIGRKAATDHTRTCGHRRSQICSRLTSIDRIVRQPTVAGHLGDFYRAMVLPAARLYGGGVFHAASLQSRIRACSTMRLDASRVRGLFPTEIVCRAGRGALNYALPEYDYQLVAMLGVSGGGWTTTLAAADRSDGSLPIYFEEPGRDYEQAHPQLYSWLYVLGTYSAIVCC